MKEQECIEVMDELREHIRTDDESDIKKARRLDRIYSKSTTEEKELIDDIFITVCGFSLGTILGKESNAKH